MDSWIKHLKLGIFLEFIFILVVYFKFSWFQLTDVVYIVIISVLSPLIMDMDHNQSKLSKTVNKLGLITIGIGLVLYYFNNNWFLIIVGLLASFIASFTTSFVKHRGIIHSILFCLLYGGIIYLSIGDSYQLAILGLFGCYTHLLGDKLPFKLL